MQKKQARTRDKSPLTISAEKVFFIIIKAREFDAKDEVTEPGSRDWDHADDMDVGSS